MTTIPCVLGKFCSLHNFIHGAEAEELRERFEKLIESRDDSFCVASEVQRVLDEVDARDSVAFLGDAGDDGEEEPTEPAAAPPDHAAEAAHAAVKYLLDRIQTDPDLYYYCGVGTQSFHLLTVAEAAHTGRPLAEVEAERRKDLQPEHRRREPEVEVLRRKLEEARG